MPSANYTSFIVDTLNTVLAQDTTLWAVQKVYKGEGGSDPTKGAVYAYVQSVAFPEGYENGQGTTHGVAQCEVMYTAKTSTDVDLTGLGVVATGDAAEMIIKLFHDYDPDTTAANNDGVFKTRINSVVVDGHVGAFDNGDTIVRLGVALTVHFSLTRI